MQKGVDDTEFVFFWKFAIVIKALSSGCVHDVFAGMVFVFCSFYWDVKKWEYIIFNLIGKVENRVFLKACL